jgi:hypothetical protein
MKIGKGLLLLMVGLLLFAGGIWLIRTETSQAETLIALPYILIGLGCGMFGHGVGNIVEVIVKRRYPELRKRDEINAKDERNIMVSSRAKSKAFDMMGYVYAALILAFALMGTSFKVLIPMVVVYLFVNGYSIYWRARFEKEF